MLVTVVLDIFAHPVQIRRLQPEQLAQQENALQVIIVALELLTLCHVQLEHTVIQPDLPVRQIVHYVMWVNIVELPV
jgi:hypothetical protein